MTGISDTDSSVFSAHHGAYFTAVEVGAGKTSLALAVADILAKQGKKVGIFFPIVPSQADLPHLETLSPNEIAYGVTLERYQQDSLIALQQILAQYEIMRSIYDCLIVIGVENSPTSVFSPVLLDVSLAEHMQLTLIVCLNAQGCSSAELTKNISNLHKELEIRGAVIAKIFLNRAASATNSDQYFDDRVPVYTIPDISHSEGGFSIANLAQLLARQTPDLVEKLSFSSVVTPQRFEYQLLSRARNQRKHIVLPEGGDDRILLAAHKVLELGIADLTILGDVQAIQARVQALEINLSSAQIIDPQYSDLRDQFAEQYTELRKHKGMTLYKAQDIVVDVSYFGTLLVYNNLADGMVSGADHTTAHTIRPAFEIIKTQPGISTVSSIFFMCLAQQVWVFGDCAIVPDPTAQQLADIAISSATTARQFGIEPRIALLSYSTGTSGAGSLVDKVAEATALVHATEANIPCEGPIQFDAAVDLTVAEKKLPSSEVAGKASVFIFPDLNAGNITYKAVQRSAHALAIGPVLQGINKPVNDLSRGALVEDIVNTIVITAIQAQK